MSYLSVLVVALVTVFVVVFTIRLLLAGLVFVASLAETRPVRFMEQAPADDPERTRLALISVVADVVRSGEGKVDTTRTRAPRRPT